MRTFLLTLILILLSILIAKAGEIKMNIPVGYKNSVAGIISGKVNGLVSIGRVLPDTTIIIISIKNLYETLIPNQNMCLKNNIYLLDTPITAMSSDQIVGKNRF